MEYETDAGQDLTQFSKSVDINSIDITNDYMFAYVMRNADICIELLEYLLPGRTIESIQYYEVDDQEASATQTVKTKSETQKSLSEAFDKRGVRLDAYLDDGKTIYNIEMQTTMQPDIAKRARLYQAHIDINQLERGLHYDLLRPSFILFICKFDPFHKGKYTYSFLNTGCEEDDSVTLDDETYKVFFNTDGHDGDVSPKLKELLRYMNDTKSYPVENTDIPLIRKIEQEVSLAKKDDEWRQTYMTYAVHQRDAELKGRREGIAIGIQSNKNATAEKLLHRGMAVNEVADVTDLSREAVQLLKNSLCQRTNIHSADQ